MVTQEELSSYGQITEITAEQKSVETTSLRTKIESLSMLERITQVNLWVKKRSFISGNVLARYAYFYDSFLIEGIGELFFTYLSAGNKKKTLSPLEIQQAVRRCNKLIKKLDGHIQHLSSELDNIIRWLDFVLVETEDAGKSKTLYDFLIDDIENKIPTTATEPNLDSLLKEKFNEQGFLKAKILLNDIRKLTAELHNTLKNAIHHQETLLYLKNLYAEVQPCDNSSLYYMERVMKIIAANGKSIPACAEGLNLTKNYLPESNKHRLKSSIKNQINLASTNEIKIYIVKKRCSLLLETFDKAINIWQTANIEKNFHMLTTQLDSLINEIEKNCIAKIKQKYASEINAENIREIENKITEEFKAMLKATFSHRNLIFFKEEIKLNLSKIKRTFEIKKDIQSLSTTIKVPKLTKLNFREQITKTISIFIKTYPAVGNDSLDLIDNIQNNMIITIDYWYKRKLTIEMITQRHMDAEHLNNMFFHIFDQFIELVPNKQVDQKMIRPTVNTLLNFILETKKTVALLESENKRFEECEKSIQDDLDELTKQLNKSTFEPFEIVINGLMEDYRNDNEETLGENIDLLTGHIGFLLALTSRVFNPQKVAQQLPEKLQKNIAEYCKNPQALSFHQEDTLIVNLGCLTKLVSTHEKYSQTLVKYETLNNDKITGKLDENAMIFGSKIIENLESSMLAENLTIIQSDCKNKILFLQELPKIHAELINELTEIIKEINTILTNNTLEPTDKQLIGFYKTVVNHSIEIIHHHLSETEKLISYPKELLELIEKQLNNADTPEVTSPTLLK